VIANAFVPNELINESPPAAPSILPDSVPVLIVNVSTPMPPVRFAMLDQPEVFVANVPLSAPVTSKALPSASPTNVFVPVAPSTVPVSEPAFVNVSVSAPVPPTTDSGALLHALSGLSTSRGTAIGQGILTSLDAIAQVDPSVASTGARPARASGYAHDVIVLLTDGSNNEGVDPQTAARQAAARGVRVFTIGFGTTNPAPLVCSGSQFNGFGGGGYGGAGYGGGFGGRNPLVADYGALRQIAGLTGGKFYRAQNANQLKAALGNLSGTFTIIREHRDIAAWFAALGGLLIAAALALSLWWNRARQPSRRRVSQAARP